VSIGRGKSPLGYAPKERGEQRPSYHKKRDAACLGFTKIKKSGEGEEFRSLNPWEGGDSVLEGGDPLLSEGGKTAQNWRAPQHREGRWLPIEKKSAVKGKSIEE